MSHKTTSKLIIFALVYILSLIALMLVVVSPPAFTDTKVVYQGF